MRKNKPLPSTNIDELEKEIAAAIEPEQKAKALYHAAALLYVSNADQSINYFTEALSLFEALGDKLQSGVCLHFLGALYAGTSKLDTAVQCYEKALALYEEVKAEKDKGNLLAYYGEVRFLQGNSAQAMEYYFNSLRLLEKIGDKKGIARTKMLIGRLYSNTTNPDLGLKYALRAMQLQEEIKNWHGLSLACETVALIYYQLKNYQLSLKYHKKSLAINKKTKNNRAAASDYNNIGHVYRSQNKSSMALNYYNKALYLYEELKNQRGIGDALHGIGVIYAQAGDYKSAIPILKKALVSGEEAVNKDQVRDTLEALYKIKKAEKQAVAALGYYERFIKVKEELTNVETSKQIANLKAGYDLELSEKERTLTEKVLFNVLPQSIATRIKNGEEKIIERFPKATVLFTDIVGFTSWSETKDVNELAQALDSLFHLFDELASENGVEKIKTIGDSYMCVAGLPEACDDHVVRIAKMGLAMHKKLKEVYPNREICLRTGIHTGEVVAGIIGKNKYAYDLWGDTVNTASRMESHGLPEKIQVTEEVFLLLRRSFQFEERGEIEVKGKGKLRTWFLLGAK